MGPRAGGTLGDGDGFGAIEKVAAAAAAAAAAPDGLGDDGMDGETAARVKVVKTLPLQTADGLLTTDWPELVWIVRDLLPVGLCLLAGKPKIGKSWLALQLAQAVACGGAFLDIPIARGKVLYLALEDSGRRLTDRMQKQRWTVGAGECDFATVGALQDIGYLNKGGSKVLAELVRARGYRLVIIDTLSRAISGDQNDVRAMTAALAPLQSMAHECGCAVLLLDHHNKMGAASPYGGGAGAFAEADPILNVLGSTGKAATADTIWGMYQRQGKPGVVLAVTGRDIDQQDMELMKDPVTFVWQRDATADELGGPKRRILDALAEMPGGATCAQVADMTGADRGNTYRELRNLVAEGRIVRTDKTYSLPTAKDENEAEMRF